MSTRNIAPNPSKAGPATGSPHEWERLRKIESKWYESFYSIIYTPPGEVPQTKGAVADPQWVLDMVAGLKEHEPQGTTLLVVSSRCGEISVDNADEWVEMFHVGVECAKEQEAYIKAGKCSLCGACSLKEAESKCRPQPLADTGDYTCPGEYLWNEEREDEENNQADGR